MLERIVLLGRGAVLRPEDLPHEVRFAQTGSGDHPTPFTLPAEGIRLDEVEQSLVRQALERTGGNQSAAARLLGISRYALRYRMAKYAAHPNFAGSGRPFPER